MDMEEGVEALDLEEVMEERVGALDLEEVMDLEVVMDMDGNGFRG